MKKLLNTSILIITNILFAQHYNKSYVSNNDVYDFQMTNCNVNNNLVNAMTVLKSSTTFRTNIVLNFLDDTGDVIGSKELETNDLNYSLSVMKLLSVSESEFIILGDYLENGNFDSTKNIVIKMNISGQILWVKKNENSTYSNSSTLLKLNDESIIIFTTEKENGNSYYSMIKLTADGDFINAKRTNLPYYMFNFNAIANDDGTFDIATSETDIINIDNDLSNINRNKKYYHNFGYSFTKNQNNEYIIATSTEFFAPAHITLFKTNENGDILWSKHIQTWDNGVQNIGNTFTVTGFEYLNEKSNGNIECIAHSENFIKGSLYFEYNPTTETIVKSKRIPFFLNRFSLNTTSAVFYTSFNGLTNGSQNIKFANVDINQDYLCDVNTLQHSITNQNPIENSPYNFIVSNSVLNISDISSQVQSNNIANLSFQSDCLPIVLSNGEFYKEDDFTIYPNPNNGSFEIKTNRNLVESEITITNYIGQKINFSFDESYLNQYKINLEKFTSGIYNLRVKTNTQVINKKMIIN
ncbi:MULTISPECIES: T9SS type A sorting domain-containing protein [Flavobacterium]|uniref:T9SS type A sorting domain-containing protein n=1 Tax=Flavobacterium jumunjinense TaxID=998845 RepID=A0ABV5GJE9_9FLAO|nr:MULTISPECIES: T9SS type A sorting domain-containing protein [Flavobacterium]